MDSSKIAGDLRPHHAEPGASCIRKFCWGGSCLHCSVPRRLCKVMALQRTRIDDMLQRSKLVNQDVKWRPDDGVFSRSHHNDVDILRQTSRPVPSYMQIML